MWGIASWVFSVVVMGILLNVISHYLIPYLDKYLERWSNHRRITNEKKRKDIENEINKMLLDPIYATNVIAKRTTYLLASSIFIIPVATALFFMRQVISLPNEDLVVNGVQPTFLGTTQKMSFVLYLVSIAIVVISDVVLSLFFISRFDNTHFTIKEYFKYKSTMQASSTNTTSTGHTEPN